VKGARRLRLTAALCYTPLGLTATLAPNPNHPTLSAKVHKAARRYTQTEGEKLWPVILFLHGGGDRIEVIKNYGDVPPIVCYPGRLNQVFLCFLVNAIEAIEGTDQIAITTLQKDDTLHITIKDTGIGIPEENLDKIFEPGFTTKGVGVGTGLGLSICYQIVQDHKGRIQVESKAGEGAAFTTILPYSFSGFILR